MRPNHKTNVIQLKSLQSPPQRQPKETLPPNPLLHLSFVIFVFYLSKYVCFIFYFLPFLLNHPKVNFRHHDPLSLNTSTCIS